MYISRCLGVSYVRAEVVILDEEALSSSHPDDTSSNPPPVSEIQRKKEEKKRRGLEQRAARKQKIKSQKAREKAAAREKSQNPSQNPVKTSGSTETMEERERESPRHDPPTPLQKLMYRDQDPVSDFTEKEVEAMANNFAFEQRAHHMRENQKRLDALEERRLFRLEQEVHV